MVDVLQTPPPSYESVTGLPGAQRNQFFRGAPPPHDDTIITPMMSEFRPLASSPYVIPVIQQPMPPYRTASRHQQFRHDVSMFHTPPPMHDGSIQQQYLPIRQPQPDNIEMTAPNVGWHPTLLTTPSPSPPPHHQQSNYKTKIWLLCCIKCLCFIFCIIVIIIVVIIILNSVGDSPPVYSAPKIYTSYNFDKEAWLKKRDQNHILV